VVHHSVSGSSEDDVAQRTVSLASDDQKIGLTLVSELQQLNRGITAKEARCHSQSRGAKRFGPFDTELFAALRQDWRSIDLHRGEVPEVDATQDMHSGDAGIERRPVLSDPTDGFVGAPRAVDADDDHHAVEPQVLASPTSSALSSTESEPKDRSAGVAGRKGRNNRIPDVAAPMRCLLGRAMSGV